jgi:hypothetical protein
MFFNEVLRVRVILLEFWLDVPRVILAWPWIDYCKMLMFLKVVGPFSFMDFLFLILLDFLKFFFQRNFEIVFSRPWSSS